MSGLNSSRLGEKDKSSDLKNSVEKNWTEGGREPVINSLRSCGVILRELCQLSFYSALGFRYGRGRNGRLSHLLVPLDLPLRLNVADALVDN